MITMCLQWGLFFAAYHPLWLWPAMIVSQAIAYYREQKQRILMREYGLMMMLFHAISYYWLIYPLQDKMHFHGGQATTLMLVCAGIHTVIFMILVWVRRSLQATHLFPIISWGLLWVSFEYIKAVFLGGFPWQSIALTQVDGPLSSLLPYTGQTGLTFIVCIAGAAIAYRQAALFISITLVLMLLNLTPKHHSPINTLSAYAYQTNSTERERKSIYERLDLLTQPHPEHAELVVFPEGTFSLSKDDVRYIESHPQFSSSFSGSNQTHLLYGVNIENEDRQIENAIRVINHQGFVMQYNKSFLVPFAEKVPYGFSFLQYFVGSLPKYYQGKSSGILNMGGKLINLKICYDMFFPDFFKPDHFHATVVVIDDEWYHDAPVREIHLRQIRLYALMTQKEVLSVTTNGISAHVGLDGAIQQQLDKNIEGFLDVSMSLFDHRMFSSRFSVFDVLIWSLILVLMLELKLRFYRIRQRPKAKI